MPHLTPAMQPTAHSAAFMRETRMVSKLNARRLMAGVNKEKGRLTAPF